MTQNGSNAKWSAIGLLGVFFGLAVAATLVIQPGCSASECTGTGGNQALPSSAVECGAGFLCYRGACVGGCNAGAERAESCKDDGDCGDAVRGKCVDGFCSSCDENEYCVPSLNICERVRSIEIDAAIAGDVGSPTATLPVDGGQIDGSVFRLSDTGVEEVINVPVSHKGWIEITQTEHLTGGQGTSTEIRARVLEFVNTPTVATRVGDEVADPGDRFFCEVLKKELIRPEVEVDIGVISIGTGDDSGLRGGPYQLTFMTDGQGYVVTPVPPANDLFVFSQPMDISVVSVTSPGDGAIATSPYPGVGQPSPTVPFRLVTPDRPTLQTGFSVLNPIQASIELTWPRPLTCPGQPLERCRGRGQQVFVRIDSTDHELVCTAFESGKIELTESLLRTFREALITEGETFPTTKPLYFERRFDQKMSVPTNIEVGYRVDLTVTVSHQLKSSVTFF